MPDNFICGKCGKVAKTKQALERHAAYHEDDRPFSCEVCLQRFKNSDDRGKHYRRLKKDGKFLIACTVCHKHFKTEEILKKHIEMLGCNMVAGDDKGKQEEGNIVDTEVKGSAISSNNEILTSDSITCTCKICETEFLSTASLKKHYRDAHSDSKRQVCIQCGQTLSSKDSLARHFSIFHQTSFPYSCDICDQKFKIKESLCRHMKFVHQDGGYQCPECNRVFSQPVNLKKHLAVHSTRKEFICRICGREFRWKQALQKHELLHEMQSGSKKSSKTIDSSLRNTANPIANASDESHDDEDDDEFDNTFEEDEKGIQNASWVTRNEDNDSVSINKNLNNGSFGELIYNPRNAHLSSVSNDFENGNSHTFRNENEIVGKKNDEYYFCEDDSDLNRVTCDDIKIAKRMGTVTGTQCSDKKKLKLLTEESIKNKSESLSTEGSFRSGLQINASEETNKVNFDKKCASHKGKLVCNKLQSENNLSETANNIKHKTTDSEISGNDISHNVHGIQSKTVFENCDKDIKSNMGFKKFKYLSLTSFPTDKTKDAPSLVFKPSSLPNIMAGSEDPAENSRNFLKDTCDSEGKDKCRKPFRFPTALRSLYTKLHNPFLIPNSNPEILPTIGHKDRTTEKDDSEMDTVGTKSATAPREHSIPSGKFSLVKHMLSLQNEDNFDKKLFENPLYNKPADVKDFEEMIERHRVTDKTDNSIVQSYDLSAKQNIPFHWLGMSVAKRKRSIADIDGDKDNAVKNAYEKIKQRAQNTDEIGQKAENTATVKSSDCNKTEVSRDVCVRESCVSSGQDKIHRGFQAIKNLVAAQKNDNLCQASAEKSVLTNPFDYENKSFQEKPTDLSNCQINTGIVPKHSHSSCQREIHSAKYEADTVTAGRREKEKMQSLNNPSDQDIFHHEKGNAKQVSISRHHSVDSYCKTTSVPSFIYSEHNLPLPKSYTGTSVVFSSVSNSAQFLRSRSTPSSLGKISPLQQNRFLEPDQAIPAHNSINNTLNEARTYPAADNSVEALPYIAHGHFEKEARFPNVNMAVNREFDTVLKEDGGGISHGSDIDLTMPGKHFAQLQKVNYDVFERSNVKMTERDKIISENSQRNVMEHLHKKTHVAFSPYMSSEHQRSVSCMSTNANVNDNFNENDGEEAFSIVNKIHAHSSNSVSRIRYLMQRTPGNSSEFQRDSERDILGADFGKSNAKVHERDRGIQDVEKPASSQYDKSKKVEVSVFDMLKEHEEKWKDFDNIETLLGSYV